MNDLDDLDVLAARTAVSTWKGKEGILSQEIQRSDRVSRETLESWLVWWGLARAVARRDRDRLLAFINDQAIPAFRNANSASGDAAYEIVEHLSQSVVESGTSSKRHTSLISKLGLSMLPEVFVPYDSTVRKALKRSGHKVPKHGYARYMAFVLAEKPAFVRTLAEKGLTAIMLGAGEMSQSLFEMRALDKRLMLKGGFSPKAMARDLVRG
jgi:hypothetical protein